MTANPNPGGNVYKREGEELHEAWNAVIRKVNEERENPPEDTYCEPLDPIDEVDENHVWTVQDVEDVRAAIDEMCPYNWEEDLICWQDAIITEIEGSMERDHGGWGDIDECCEETGGLITEFGPFIYDGQLLEASVCEDICCGEVKCTNACYICPCDCGAWSQHMGDYWPPNGPVLESYALTAFYSFGGIGIGGRQAMIDWGNATDTALDAAKHMDSLQNTIDSWVAQVDHYIAAYEACLIANPENPSACSGLKTYICYYGNLARARQDELDEEHDVVVEEVPKIASAAAEFDNYAAINWAAQMACPGGRYPPDVNVMADIGENYEGYAWGKWFRPKFDDSLYDCRPQGYLNGAQTVYFSPNGTPMRQGLVLRTLTVIYQRIIIWHVCDQWPGGQCYWDCTGQTIDVCGTFDQCTTLEITGGCGFAPKESPALWQTLYNIAASKHYEFNGYVYDPLRRQGKDYTDEQNEFWNEHINWYDEHPQYDDRHEAYC